MTVKVCVVPPELVTAAYQPLLVGYDELMFDVSSNESDIAPPPSILVFRGQLSRPELMVPAGTDTAPDCSCAQCDLGLAQTAHTSNVVSMPLALFTSAFQVTPFGNELLILAAGKPYVSIDGTLPPRRRRPPLG